jgi:hypothetical protein
LRTVTQFVILKKKRFLNSFEKRIFEGHGLCFLWWSPWTSKKPKSVGGETKIFWFGKWKYIVYEKNKNLFHIRLQLIIWDKCSCFLLILMILQILNFFVKKMPNIVHTYVVKLLLHLLKEKIDLVFDPPWPIQIFK